MIIEKLGQHNTAIKGCIKSWFDKCSVSLSSFFGWPKAMMSAIDRKIHHLSVKVTAEKIKCVFKPKDEIITQKLKMLREKLDVVPVDKANSNVIFVCQKVLYFCMN